MLCICIYFSAFFHFSYIYAFLHHFPPIFIYLCCFFSCIFPLFPIYREGMHVHPFALPFIQFSLFFCAYVLFFLHFFFFLSPIYMDFPFSLFPPRSPMSCFSRITASTVAPVSLARALRAISTLALRTNPAKSGKGSWDASIKVRRNEGKGYFRC